MVVSNITELKEFILNNDLSQKDIQLLLKSTLNVYLVKEYDKKDLVKMIENFYSKYQNSKERPIFLDP